MSEPDDRDAQQGAHEHATRLARFARDDGELLHADEKPAPMTSEQMARFDEASNHPYECRCEICLEWWEQIGPEEDGDDVATQAYASGRADQLEEDKELLAWAYAKLQPFSFSKQEDALQMDRIKLLLTGGQP